MQLTLFEQRLPKKPYHTDEFATGLAIARAQNALKSRYIQANGPTHKYWLIFDVDSPDAALGWYDLGAPAPNIVATNREIVLGEYKCPCLYFYIEVFVF